MCCSQDSHKFECTFYIAPFPLCVTQPNSSQDSFTISTHFANENMQVTNAWKMQEFCSTCQYTFNCQVPIVCEMSHHLQSVSKYCSKTLCNGPFHIALWDKCIEEGATYVGLPGSDVGSGSGKEDKGIFYNRINNIAPRFFSSQAASYKQQSAEMRARSLVRRDRPSKT